MTCIYCAKKNPFKTSSWQLNAFVIRFFWTKPAALHDSSHTFMKLWQSELPYDCSPAVCVRSNKGDLCHCWAFTSWQPGAWRLKNNPALSNFVIFWDCFSPSLSFDFLASPRNARGQRRATSSNTVPHLNVRNCPKTYTKVGHQRRKGSRCHISELRTRWPKLNTVSEWQKCLFHLRNYELQKISFIKCCAHTQNRIRPPVEKEMTTSTS